MSNSPCLTSAEAAAFLKVTIQTLARWRVEGSGPVYSKLNRTVLYEYDDLLRFVRNNKRRSTSNDEIGPTKKSVLSETEGGAND